MIDEYPELTDNTASTVIPHPYMGMLVHYVLDGEGYITDLREISKGDCRPAIIVRIFSKPSFMVQLQVFTDGTNDGSHYASGLIWRTSVHYSQDKKPGTWHYQDHE